MTDSRFKAALGDSLAPKERAADPAKPPRPVEPERPIEPPAAPERSRPAAPDLDEGLADYDPYLPTTDVTGAANAAAWTAMSALLCAAVGPFTCYTSYFLSLVLGIIAIWQSSRVIKVPGMDPAVRGVRTLTYASLTGGIIATLMSAGIVLLFLVIMLFYVAMIVLAIIGGIAGA